MISTPGSYMNAIGAKTGYDDDVFGSMCWCPITNLDLGDAAYEWNMGLTRSNLGSADQSISAGLATGFAEYVNAIGFKHPSSGNTLTLSATSDGYYQSGSYYECVMEVINDAVERYNTYNSVGQIVKHINSLWNKQRNKRRAILILSQLKHHRVWLIEASWEVDPITVGFLF